MATNNFIVSSLPAYVQELEPVLIDQVSVKGPTIDRIAIQTGIKKSANLNYLDVRPVLQNGAGCGFRYGYLRRDTCSRSELGRFRLRKLLHYRPRQRLHPAG